MPTSQRKPDATEIEATATPSYHDVLSGARRGISAVLLRGVLSMAEPFYGVAVALRNLVFDAGWRGVYRAACPVISVGNLTTGGTGKTPLVHWLLRHCGAAGRCAAVISRGYRALAHGWNDEAIELSREFPHVIHEHDRRRARAAQRLLSAHDVHLIVLDDGFQHRQMARDLDIVTVDALEPWGFGRLLPRGLLREPTRALRRADFVVVTRCNLTTTASVEAIVQEAEKYIERSRVVLSAVVPRQWIGINGSPHRLDDFAARPVLAFCGLGQPRAFFATLKELRLDVRAWRVFPDHHHYSREDISLLREEARVRGISVLVCTMKDLVKLHPDESGDTEICGLQVTHQFVAGEATFIHRVNELVHAATGP